MQKNASVQPLQAVIQIISCFCCHLGQISYQIPSWMLWRNCLHLTKKQHSWKQQEEIKWKHTVWKHVKGATEHTTMVMISIILSKINFVHFTHKHTLKLHTVHITIDLEMHSLHIHSGAQILLVFIWANIWDGNICRLLPHSCTCVTSSKRNKWRFHQEHWVESAHFQDD